MNKIKITSDSTIDLSKELKERYGISTMALEVNLGDESFEDGVTVDPDKIYAFVQKTGQLPKTAAKNQAAYEDFFADQLKNAESVLHYSLSSGVSASCAEATKAAKSFGGRVEIVDTLALSTGTALLALDGWDCVQKGMGISEIAARSRARTGAVQTSFIVDKLDFLYKGGRCSKLQLLGSNLLKIKPTIEMHEGTLHVGKKFRGRLEYAAIDYVNEILDKYNTPDLKRIFVTHTAMEESTVQLVIDTVKARCKFAEVYETLAGSTITSHCGKGTIGILYLNDGGKYD